MFTHLYTDPFLIKFSAMTISENIAFLKQTLLLEAQVNSNFFLAPHNIFDAVHLRRCGHRPSDLMQSE